MEAVFTKSYPPEFDINLLVLPLPAYPKLFKSLHHMVGDNDITLHFPRATSSPDDRRTPGQPEHRCKVVCEGGGDSCNTLFLD
jgi:hypothetical protein